MKVIVPKAITPEGLINLEDIVEEKIIVTDINIIDKETGETEFVMPIDSKRITSLGDIVIKLSTPFDSATITEDTIGCLIPSFCAIIRNKGLIDEDYLQAFLNSKLCKDQLRAKVVGTVMTILSIGKIKEIEIPIPETDQQIAIGKRYREAQTKISTLKKIVELETKRNDIQFINMVK
jgi:restriction endonuclease S subunit